MRSPKLREALLMLSMLAFANSTPAIAADPIECLQGLKDVWYNTYQITDKQTSTRDMKTLLDWNFEQLDTEIRTQKSSGGGSLKVPIPIMENVFNFGASAYSSSDSNWQKNHKVKEAYRSMSESSSLDDTMKAVFIKTASHEAVEAYRECVQATQPLRVRTGGDVYKDFQLNVLWTQQPATQPSIKITEVSLSGAKFASPQIFPITVNSGAAKSFNLLRMSPRSRGFITVSTTGGTRFVDLAQYVPQDKIRTSYIPVIATNANQTPTGLNVKKGDTVSVTVTNGTWTISKAGYGNYPESNGTGMTWAEFQTRDPQWAQYTWPMKAANPGALVSKIGNVWTQIGSGNSWTATEDGELMLSINDAQEGLGLSDNNGILKVTITVTTPAEESGVM